MATAVLGLQWGDEGKGKFTHLLAREADMVVRFNGGPNAGHTVIDRGVKFGTHLVPAGVFYEGTVSVLASGMVIDLGMLHEELEAVSAHLGKTPKLLIAENAHLIFPYHRMLEELEGSGSHFGTTRRGIAPTYSDKAKKIGIRLGDLLRPGDFERRLDHRLSLLRRDWPGASEIHALSAKDIVREQLELAEPILASIGDATAAIDEALRAGKNVLFEGAQGTLLDVDHGTFPYVTSSSTTYAGLGNSIGIAAPDVEHRLGICKAYQTRVGAGPFPTELTDDRGEGLRERGGEYGVTTGRPRRCGWLDGVALRYAVRLNGITGLALTKLDVLDGLEEIRIAGAYRLRGETVERFPLAAEELAVCTPIYDSLPGWDAATTDARTFEDLPAEAVAYVERIEAVAGVPVEMISVGPGPEATIRREL
jgi:adenylosuccinate synthase